MAKVLIDRDSGLRAAVQLGTVPLYRCNMGGAIGDSSLLDRCTMGGSLFLVLIFKT